MPRTRRYRRRRRARTRRVRASYGRKFMRRRKRRSGAKTRILRLRGVTCFPDAMFVKMRWNFAELVDTGLATSYAFKANDPFLPLSVSTTRAMGWDQYATFYGRYMVHSSSIYITLTSKTTSAVQRVVLYPSTNNTADTVDSAITYPYNKRRVLGSQNGGQSRVKASLYYAMDKIRGKKSLDDANFTALTSASPITQYYFFLVTEVADPAVDTNAFFLEAQMIFNVHFYNRKDLPESEVPALMEVEPSLGSPKVATHLESNRSSNVDQEVKFFSGG